MKYKKIILFVLMLAFLPLFSEARSCNALKRDTESIKKDFYKAQTELADLNIKLNKDLEKESKRSSNRGVIESFEAGIWYAYEKNFRTKKAQSDSLALKYEIASEKYNDCIDKKYRDALKKERKESLEVEKKKQELIENQILRENMAYCKSLKGEYVYNKKHNKCEATVNYLNKQCKVENKNSWWNRDKKLVLLVRQDFIKNLQIAINAI